MDGWMDGWMNKTWICFLCCYYYFDDVGSIIESWMSRCRFMVLSAVCFCVDNKGKRGKKRKRRPKNICFIKKPKQQPKATILFLRKAMWVLYRQHTTTSLFKFFFSSLVMKTTQTTHKQTLQMKWMWLQQSIKSQSTTTTTTLITIFSPIKPHYYYY